MKRLFTLLLALLPVVAYAQISVQFGYLSYDSVMHEMPQYIKAQADIKALRAKYDSEAQRGEEEFQKKFVEFLQGQKDFPQTILQKRQGELQYLMDNGVNFRTQAQALIQKAENDMVSEVRKILNNAILAVGVENGYGVILNTDNNGCPFINPVIGVDVSDLVRIKLGLIEAPKVPVVPTTEIKAVEQAPVQVVAPPTETLQNAVQQQQQEEKENANVEEH